MRAKREDSTNTGYGVYGGIKIYSWRNLFVSGEFDYLDSGQDDAKSVYIKAQYSANANLMLKLSTAVRFENKALYGENRAVGLESQCRYRINNHFYVDLNGSYIWNTRLKDEFLSRIQLTYYFDNFQPKVN